MNGSPNRPALDCSMRSRLHVRRFRLAGSEADHRHATQRRMNKLLTFVRAWAVLLSRADTLDIVGMPPRKDRDLAAIWVGLASETNSPLGTSNLSVINAEAISGRIQDLKVQAEKGVAVARYALGYCYF